MRLSVWEDTMQCVYVRVLFSLPTAKTRPTHPRPNLLVRTSQLVAEILQEATDILPAPYVFDVVDSNFNALDRVSRTAYRLVCLAEDSTSALDGRSAANILRQVSPSARMDAHIGPEQPLLRSRQIERNLPNRDEERP